MKLFSKLKDYNNLLEKILDEKTFSSVAKSLLLSMIYKLEVSYKDYFQVKPDSLENEKFFENILNIVDKYCDNVKIVEPESIQAKLLYDNNVDAVTNTKERSILSYPTEQAMLYALTDIEPKYYFVKKDFPLKNILQRTLVEGYKENTLEVLKNFNGWSWDINVRLEQKYISNIIYQNLIMIMGEEFLYNWRITNVAKKNFLKELKDYLNKITQTDEYYSSLIRLLYLSSSQEEREKINSNSEKISKEYFNEYKIISNYNATEYEELANLQKCFLKFVQIKIENIQTIEEINKILYELRYYQNIVFFKGVLIKNYRPLQKSYNNVLKLAITKACKLGAIKIISMDIDTNFEIIKYILDTKILNFNEIKINIDCQKDKIFIKVYDNEVFEKQGEIAFSGNKKDIVIRKKRNIKLFN